MAGRTPGPTTDAACWVHARARSSQWPILSITPGAKPRAKRRSRCLPSRSRSCVASIHCSTSSDPSMARAPRRVGRFDKYRASLWSKPLRCQRPFSIDDFGARLSTSGGERRVFSILRDRHKVSVCAYGSSITLNVIMTSFGIIALVKAQ
jgi:hypothetical protein